MRNKDIKKMIKLNIESNIPKHAPRIDFPFDKTVKVTEKRKLSLNFKYVMSGVFAVFVIILGFAFWPGDEITPTPTNKLLNSDHEIVSFSAISSISLLSTLGTNDLIGLESNRITTTQQPDVITKVLPYLKSIEQLLLSESGLNIVSGASNLPEYEYMMQFETKNLANISTSYIMHYNLTLKEDDGDESEYSIEGILIFGQKTYDVIGEKEMEDDEEKVTFKAFIDENNYVESLYKLEDKKQKFEFLVVQNGFVISESLYEIEYDKNETKVKLSFTEGNNSGEFEFEYYTKNGIHLIKIEFEIDLNGVESSGEMIVQMIIDEITGNARYLIRVSPEDGDEYEYETDDEEDEDEEDEDEEDEEDEDEDEEDEVETEE